MGTNDKARAMHAARAIAKSVVDTVKEAGPQGAPESSIYLAMSEQGCTQEQYQTLISVMCEAGMIRRSNNCLYVG